MLLPFAHVAAETSAWATAHRVRPDARRYHLATRPGGETDEGDRASPCLERPNRRRLRGQDAPGRVSAPRTADRTPPGPRGGSRRPNRDRDRRLSASRE